MRRFAWFKLRPAVHLSTAGLLVLVLMGGDFAVIPSARTKPSIIVTAVVIVGLILMFLFLARRGED